MSIFENKTVIYLNNRNLLYNSSEEYEKRELLFGTEAIIWV
jgi:hypothetical protein